VLVLVLMLVLMLMGVLVGVLGMHDRVVGRTGSGRCHRAS
jgi:hypothetical protein